MLTNRTKVALLAGAMALTAHSAMAVALPGGIDPGIGLLTLWTNARPVLAMAICSVCGCTGFMAVHRGDRLAPHIGSAVGGTLLAFGGPTILGWMGYAG